MKKNMIKKLTALSLVTVAKKTVNSSGCCVWYQPVEPKILEKYKCKKEK
ncbi:AgrD family cyclic lactone autoinducer peptide [[Eubacterium] hominis]